MKNIKKFVSLILVLVSLTVLAIPFAPISASAASTDVTVTESISNIYVDTSIHGSWHGTLTGLRLDPIENQGASFEIAQIEFLEGTPKVQLSGFMSSLEEKIARLETAVADLESQLEDAQSQAEEAMDEEEDLRSELESLRAQMEEKD